MAWLSNGIGEAAIDHVIGVTAEPERARSLGLPEERILEVPLGVGGRFSLGSAVGFPVMVAIGPEAFHEVSRGCTSSMSSRPPNRRKKTPPSS
ncbi:MAG: hypothetical protein Ct9H300mP31_01580 [Acidimicrobiaceae bacterium]|nr:MAG: hypothetical protein Ct9H300mP31_01580 [Acidimicrobiaceae bacterium]